MPLHHVFCCRRTKPLCCHILFLLLAFPLRAAPNAGHAGELASGEEAAPLSGSSAKIARTYDRQRAEILAQLGVDRWHGLGYRGHGVTVAVLDTGFRGYRHHLGMALPQHVTVRSFRKDCNLEAKNSQHGILCAEVIHAVAPEARLLFANWDSDRPEQFLQAAQWARHEGAQVISCSLIMPSWSDGEGGGAVNAALAVIVGPGRNPGDALFFASAGNTAQRHWTGMYREGQAGFHEWVPGETENRLTPWGTDPVSVEMCWQSEASYEVVVEEASTGRAVAHARGRSPRRGAAKRACAVARFTPHSGKSYQVRVRLLEGKPGKFHLIALGGELSRSRARGSISCPADGPAVVAIGAVDRRGQRIWYSACGPNSARPKPDFVAMVPFPSRWRERPFTGTSAAAPQAAALAALWWCRHPSWKAERVMGAMRATALDLGPAGHDYETGYGLIRLP
jgi:subtilisin family serine protease